MIQIAESQTLAQNLDDVRGRTTDLQDQITKLNVEIETLRYHHGRAMAVGHKESTITNIRRELRNAEDEKEGAERAIVYLAEESERLAEELTAAKADEAAADRDAKVANAVETIDELAKALSAWLESFLPLAERAISHTDRANNAEKRAATLAGNRVPVIGRTHREGWAKHPGLEVVTSELRRHAQNGSA